METFEPPQLQELHRNSYLILIVEDDEDNLLLTTYILDCLNLNYLVAVDSSSILELAEAHQPNLILLDMILPDISGMEIARRLKQNLATKHIPIVAITALAFPEEREAIKRAGCDDYLVKPFLIEQLEAKIRSFLN